ncbi:MAG: mucoidy inhibitor MuiA family protein [Deltaproteobacteria bacterium]|nr:mucoidy inhibitor MuiA family protein [Deltaproteobacteria bacterium]
MMSTTRSIGKLAVICLGAWLVTTAGCAQTATTAGVSSAKKTAGAAGVDPSIPQASLVSPDDPQAVTLASAIKKVTVFSDRAMVTREAAAKVTAEPTVYAFKQLPGWVDEGSVRVASTAGRILDVRVARTYLARATEESYRKAEAEARQLTARMAALDDEIKVLDAKTKQVEDIKVFSLDKLHKDVVVGNVGVSTYGPVVEFIAKTLRETAQARRAVQAEREKLGPELEASRKKLEDLKALTQLEETKVFVTLQGTAPADAQVALSYALPGATWETLHELRAPDADPTSVEVTSFAVVTQVSGEDWNNAELTFSTQSSTAAVRIPELEALTLGDTRAATQSIERQSASFRRAEAAFKGQNRLWNKRVQSVEIGSNFEESYQTNFEYLQVVTSKTVQIFQSLQQRGTTAQFKAMSTTKVRADGRSVRVPIGRVNLKSKKAIVAAPEQSLNAAQTLEMLNESGQPLLPGNVALYQGGAFLGMTNLDFVADGEPFAVFMSVADQLKLSRALDKKHSALIRKQRYQMQLAFIVTVENLSSKATTLKLADRIPVSEDRDIVISGVKINPDAKPDSKGILHWPLTLQPKEKRKFEIQYQIEYPPTLVVEMRRNKAAEPSPAATTRHGASPASPAPPAKAYDLKRDIEQLENAF